MKLYIKNMVCTRCKTIVKAELDKIGVQYVTVELGEVNTLLEFRRRPKEHSIRLKRFIPQQALIMKKVQG